MSIEVLNESGEADVNEEMLVDVCSFALQAMDVHPDTEATITLVDEATMADLHVRWMDLEGPTDVMSFPMDELTPGGGRPDASPFGAAMLGYDHVMPDEEREMFSLQNELLADWYDSLAARGIKYQPKPTGAHAFPSAADREELDRMMKGHN